MQNINLRFIRAANLQTTCFYKNMIFQLFSNKIKIYVGIMYNYGQYGIVYIKM